MRIRIVSPPPGEPPADIRAAWVGCVLPLFARSEDPRVGRQVKGALSGQIKDAVPGYTVRVVDALRELERQNAQAARWWHDNVPQLMQPGKLFVFPAEACELVEANEPTG
jgi:hypothetical protein